MLDLFKTTLNEVTATLVPVLLSAALGLIWRGYQLSKAKLQQANLGILNNGLSRAAGQILEAVANSPLGELAGDTLLNEGVRYVRRSFPDLLKKLGDPTDEHIKEMIRGEVGKLQAAQTIVTPTISPVVNVTTDGTATLATAVQNVAEDAVNTALKKATNAVPDLSGVLNAPLVNPFNSDTRG